MPMIKSEEDFVKFYKSNMEKQAKAASEEAGQQIAKRFEKELPKVVAKAMKREDGEKGSFYTDYTPTYYKRTDGLYEGVTKGTIVERKGDGIKLRIVSSYVPDHKHDTGEYIFKGAGMGYHGTQMVATTTPPSEYISKYGNEILNDIVTEECKKVKQKYFR